MAKIKWTSGKLLSISAMSMSFITLLIFVYQTNLLRKQNFISILPYLSVTSTNNSARPLFSLDIQNHGVGPAIIESVKISYRDSTYNLIDYENNMYILFTHLEPKLDSIKNLSQALIIKGMAIPANSQYNIISVTNSMEEYYLMSQTLMTMLDEGLNYDIIYSSIQNERWLIRYDSEGPVQLN